MMHLSLPLRSCSMFVAFASLAVGPMAAQSESQAVRVALDAAGVATCDGPSFQARFEAQGARFEPRALGLGAASGTDALQLGAVEVRRGAVRIALADVEPTLGESLVEYRRAPGVVERFALTAAGLEHSVLVDGPLGGAGDLVVRIALGAELGGAGRRAGDGSHVFGGGAAAVTYGTLTGIDARGATVHGDVRLVDAAGGAELELVLPSAFVARAAWPILLDPLVGASFFITDSLKDYSDGDVAYDASTDWFLSVYRVGPTSAIEGRMVQSGGGASAVSIPIGPASTTAKPRVANLANVDKFLVAWLEDTASQTHVRCCTVIPGGSVSNILTLASAPLGSITSVDVGGDSFLAFSPAPPSRGFVVWATPTGGIQCAVIAVDGAALFQQPYHTQQLTIAPDPGPFDVLDQPAISRTMSANERLGVAWIRTNSLTGARQVYATAIKRSGLVLHTPVLVSGADVHCSAPDVDGGGESPTRYVVAWQSKPVATFALKAAALQSATALSVGPVATLVPVASPAPKPAVGWRPGLAFVAYTSGIDLRMRAVDPVTAAGCGVEEVVEAGDTFLATSMDSAAVCMRAAGGDTYQTFGMVTWTRRRVFPSTGDTLNQMGRVLDALNHQAQATGLGGGCGSAGAALAPQVPALGNGTFRMDLVGAGPTAALAFLNVSTNGATFDCGACQWVSFATTFTHPVVAGGASQALPIPCTPALAGAVVYAQWTVYQPGATPCALVPDFGLSNIVKLTLN